MTQGAQHLAFWMKAGVHRFVYVIQGDEGTPIKVGITDDVDARMRGLQTATYQELRLLDVVPGSGALERALHRRLRPARIRGEWFGGEMVVEFMEFFSELGRWMTAGYQDKGVVPDFRHFGDGWDIRTPAGSDVRVRFVDPATISGSQEEQAARRHRAANERALGYARRHRDSPFNPEAIDGPQVG